MSVTLFEPALERLLDSQEGPVGRYVERVAEAVVVLAEIQFDTYYHHVLAAEQNIDFIMEGSTATVGYADGPKKSKSRRIARAEAEGKLEIPPIRTALERVSNGG